MVARDLLLQSKHQDTDFYSCPMDGEHMKEIHNSLGEDFVALEIFVDDIEPNNPIGSKSSIYKLFVAYVSVKNMKRHVNACLVNRFLFVVAYSSDGTFDMYDTIQTAMKREIERAKKVRVFFFLFSSVYLN